MSDLELVNPNDLQTMQNMLGSQEVPARIVNRYLDIKRLTDRVSCPVHPSVIALLVLDDGMKIGPAKVETERQPEPADVQEETGEAEEAVNSGPAAPEVEQEPEPEISQPGYPKGTRVEFMYQGQLKEGTVLECPDADNADVQVDGGPVISVSLDEIDVIE